MKKQVENEKKDRNEQYSLNDDRRVKVLSPGQLVAKRFFRNRLAVTGLSILVFMFVFSFIGGLISPYSQDQFFYRNELLNREFAAVTENKEFRYMEAEKGSFGSAVNAQAFLAISQGRTEFSYKDVNYTVEPQHDDLYTILSDGKVVGIAYKDVVRSSSGSESLSFDFTYNALLAYTSNQTSFSSGDKSYTIDETGGILEGNQEVAYISRFVVEAKMPDIALSRDFKEKLIVAIQNGETEFTYTDESLILDEEEGQTEDETGGIHTDDPVEEPEGEKNATATYLIERSQNQDNWIIRQEQVSYQYDKYSFPSKTHLLGTDKYGMDMLTRLMYGGRVSLVIGFIVVIIETALGIIMGGISGYFGGWVDNLIMRLVDIFYCIPSTPMLIILGAAMDAARVDPMIRMVYLMLILGFLGWAGIARLVRGQILSLREQEFMTATEACGISVRHRIFKHLIPNVMPQLIVQCTMSLGGVIITEATLSFLGLGVKFPFASWGNIINDVNNTFVLTNYWFIWIPASVLLLLTVLAFNLVGDGLRDAFDPKMKR